MFEKFWELYEAVSDDTPDGWVQGFQFGAEMNAAALEIMAYENSLNPIDEDEEEEEEDREIDVMRERVRWADSEDEDEEEFPASILSRLRKQRGKESIMNALNDTHYAAITAVHEQMPSHLFMSGDNTHAHTLMWYTERAGGKEEHSLRFDSYAAQRAFISALEREGYFAQTSVTGLMFRRDSMRIPASVLATIYKPKDDREIRQNAQIHANLAIAYELAAIVMEAHSSVSNALYYRQCANDEVSQIPLYLHDEYRQQLSHALYINGYLR